MSGEGNYVCTLDEETQQKALRELNEDPKQRKSQIESLRQWVKTQPHLNSRTDDLFLLRFLRVAKFSQLRAQELVDNFWTARSVEVRDWFDNMDPRDKTIQEILDAGVQIILPGRDDEGRKVVMVRSGVYDPKVYSLGDIMKVSFMVLDAMLLDEPTQIHGIVVLQDFENISLGHLLGWNRDTIKKASKCWQDVYPFRNKGGHFFRTPAFLNPIIDVFMYFSKEKNKQRTKFHKSSLESLHSAIPKRMLPNELEGTGGPLKDIVDGTKQLILNHRDEFLLNARYGVDESRRPKRDTSSSSWGALGSFRKLSID